MANPQRREAPRQGNGLRTKFFPRSRIGEGLISVAPWVDVVLLIVFFLLVGSRVVLQPGVVVALPEGPFTEGTRPGLIAVVLSVGGEAGRREDIVFFDDERFRVADARQRDALRAALTRAHARHSDASLVIQADQRVGHGTVMTLIHMATDAGMRRVNLAEKPR